MNNRTKISTIVAILTYLNGALAQFDTGILEGHPKAQLAYRIISTLLAGAAWFNSHYFNQDFSEEACKYTGMMRLEKEQNQGVITGEDFTGEIEDGEDE